MRNFLILISLITFFAGVGTGGDANSVIQEIAGFIILINVSVCLVGIAIIDKMDED